jgi:hypothetical protein
MKDMEITEIKENDVVLARHIPADVAWTDGLSFFSDESEFQQVGTWVYQQGKQLLAHAHNVVPREVSLTQEILYVKQGRIKATIFDSLGAQVAEIEAGEGDIMCLLFGGHGYEIMAENTQVLEIKNGPYLGAEIDRKRF